jgi:hypothetical protein
MPAMHCLHLLISLPTGLDEALACARRAAPSLAALLGRGDPLPAEASLAGTCCRAFGVDKQQDWPVAPLTASADGLEPGNAYWLRFDPVHLEVGMGGLMLHTADQLALAPEEAHGLVTSINLHWRQRGVEILAPGPARWYLRLPEMPDLRTHPLDRVAGEYLTSHLPEGGDANRLLALANEAQMLMCEHPVNQAREWTGRPPVNGVWLWGGGVMPAVKGSVDLVASDAPEVLALARGAGTPTRNCPSRHGELVRLDGGRRALVTLVPTHAEEDLEAYLAKLEAGWFRPVLRGLVLGGIRRLRLDFLASPGQAVRVGTLQAWRFWR